MRADHSRERIRHRLQQATQHSYLSDFIYGGIDGAVTTFAIVSGVAGAGLSSGVVIVLGIANLIGDGFSMAAANFLGCRAEQQRLDQARRTEAQHIRQYPEGEREEVRQILESKGFAGDSLDQAVETITANEQLWINTMLQTELGLTLELANPWKAAVVTFVAFLVVGAIPLMSFVVDYAFASQSVRPFVTSTVLTAIAFFAVGAVKARYVAARWYWSGLETLFVGGIAAGLAWFVGRLLHGIAT